MKVATVALNATPGVALTGTPVALNGASWTLTSNGRVSGEPSLFV